MLAHFAIIFCMCKSESMRANATRHLQQVGEEALLYRRQAVPRQMSRLHVNQVLPQRESNGNIAEKRCSMGATLHCLL